MARRRRDMTDDQLADWFEREGPDPEHMRDATPLRAIAAADDAYQAARQALIAAVATARHDKLSWTEVGATLGVSRQAARQRFAAAVGEPAPVKKSAAKKAATKQRDFGRAAAKSATPTAGKTAKRIAARSAPPPSKGRRKPPAH